MFQTFVFRSRARYCVVYGAIVHEAVGELIQEPCLHVVDKIRHRQIYPSGGPHCHPDCREGHLS